MASKNGAILSKIVKRSLSATTQPNVKKSLKPFGEIPGLSKKMLIAGMLTADLRKGTVVPKMEKPIKPTCSLPRQNYIRTKNVFHDLFPVKKYFESDNLFLIFSRI